MVRRHAAVLLVLTAAACSGGSGDHAARHVNLGGTIKVDDVAMGLHHCNPRFAESADDVVPGATVTVYDAKGTIVGTTTLGPGSVGPTNDTGFDGCIYTYGVTVPTSAFYQVQVAGRDKVTVDAAHADRADIAISEVGS